MGEKDVADLVLRVFAGFGVLVVPNIMQKGGQEETGRVVWFGRCSLYFFLVDAVCV